MVGLILYVHMQGRFCLYKLTEDDEDAWDEGTDAGLFRVSRGIPSNNSVQVLIRVYVVSVRPHFSSSNLSFYNLEFVAKQVAKIKLIFGCFKHLCMCYFAPLHIKTFKYKQQKVKEEHSAFSFYRLQTCTQLTQMGKLTLTLFFGLARMKSKTEIITSPNSLILFLGGMTTVR